MSDADEIEAIRERKRRELMEGAGDPGDGRVDAGEPTPGETARVEPAPANSAPSEPVYVEGADHFRDLTRRYHVVLVDYYADWCGPCQMVEPIVAEIARATDAAVVKVDVDRHQDLATDAGVRGVPTLFLYVDGEPVERLVGLQDAATLRDLVDRYA